MKKRMVALLLALMALMTLTACGAKEEASAPAAKGESFDMAITEEAPAEPEMDMNYGGGVMYDEKVELQSQSSAMPQKLICRAQLEMETTEFDAAIAALTDLTEQYNGYFENSTVRERGSGYRSAEYTIRVPADKYSAFVNQAGELCHETWRNTSQENVTEMYYDTQGRLKTQQIKLERLQELLSRAEVMEDIITIESAISETEWNIENLSGTLRHYDALVDYATVHINLSEVYKLSNVEETPDTFGDRMGAAFAGGMRAFGDNLEDMAVAFAYSWMWWLLVAAVAVAVICVLRKRRARRKAAKAMKDTTEES